MRRLFLLIVIIAFAINECSAQMVNPCGMTIQQLDEVAKLHMGQHTNEHGDTFIYLTFDETLAGFIFEDGKVIAYDLLWLDEEEDKWYTDKIKCN